MGRGRAHAPCKAARGATRPPRVQQTHRVEWLSDDTTSSPCTDNRVATLGLVPSPRSVERLHGRSSAHSKGPRPQAEGGGGLEIITGPQNHPPTHLVRQKHK
jgi:hypothetical protein